MIYSNGDPMAIRAMEEARTGNYGYDYDDDYEARCPVCDAVEPWHYYVNDDDECVGCSECIYKVDILP